MITGLQYTSGLSTGPEPEATESERRLRLETRCSANGGGGSATESITTHEAMYGVVTVSIENAIISETGCIEFTKTTLADQPNYPVAMSKVRYDALGKIVVATPR
ncbi:hypothetical protein C2857_007877 [Epichloe festucae Fl1]|uniref:Uncharacterized protein n=1 Tax=Epichloe festucae (strain Fl1) TaxID=877507 RepID=A0A7S9PTA1_EPIFF|nr:hypothetical protein C2857_007877 [Epichloe festucae Fl1]